MCDCLFVFVCVGTSALQHGAAPLVVRRLAHVQRLSTSDFDSPGDLLGTPGSETCRSHFSDTNEPVVMLTRNPERQEAAITTNFKVFGLTRPGIRTPDLRAASATL